jgi:LuxR family transcriptional regulator, maltose regulon positive regulatory protein
VPHSSDPNVSMPLENVVIVPKLSAPALRSGYLPRPRLLKLLEAGSEGKKITLIDAPPGYGKTTLLAQWLRGEGGNLPFAWISLDVQDNDPAQLWSYITEALRQIGPEEAFETDGFVGWGFDESNLIERVLPTLINSLTKLPQRVVLVLDDYHCIEESECHKLMTFFIEHLPDTIHLIFSTRHDLPLPLGRLRASGEVNEIRAEQLAFTEGEAASFLKERMHLDLGSSDLRTLLDRTEGWPAGIYLAALSLRGKDDAHAFIESFGGSNRYIVDFLVEEVLNTLSEEERAFLQQSSILERMSASLCEAVTGTKDSGRFLRTLGRSNLFVVPLDNYGEWYRYHNLLRDFLYYELKRTQPQLLPRLHERASEWFERAGQVEEAIHHAIAAGDFERAGLLVARHWLGYVARGQITTLQRWLDLLPKDLIAGDAPLCLVRAWSFALQGRGEESQRFLALAEGGSYEGKLPDGSASLEAAVHLVRGIFGYGGVQAMVEAARRAKELESPEQSSPRAVLVLQAVGMSSYYAGELSRARKHIQEALELLGGGLPLLRITLLCTLSFVAADEGRLEEAESLAREAHEVVEKFSLERAPQSSAVPIALGRALAKRGKRAEAQIELKKGVSARRRFPSLSPWPTLVGLLALAQVRSALSERGEARALFAEARSIINNYPDCGIFQELLEYRERELGKRKRPTGELAQELTERELVVLRRLDSDRSAREIGNLLHVSHNTIRTQVKSIYRKLGISSRKEAVERARAMKLL